MPEVKVKTAGAVVQGLMAEASTTGTGLKPAIFVHGPEKVGKTSWATNASRPVFICSPIDNGLLTLLDNGQVKPTAHMPKCVTWDNARAADEKKSPSTLGTLRRIRDEPHDWQTVVLDTINGHEALCYDHVCREKFGGNYGDGNDEGFLAYGRGESISTGFWRPIHTILDEIREQRGMAVIALCHTAVRNQKNPSGSDYQRYKPAMLDKQWGVTHRWADLIMFMDVVTVVEKDGLRTKGKGGSQRIARCQPSAAYDAGNRFGVKDFSLGGSAEEGYKNFIEAMKKARSK